MAEGLSEAEARTAIVAVKEEFRTRMAEKIQKRADALKKRRVNDFAERMPVERELGDAVDIVM
ncbi:MAG TPA: hypothetical protein PLB72_10320, partial [Bacteroidia bacterium]|nr:hypothetical protein [Bacteroidia bacterium]